jgi:hypothetical protein
MIGGYEVAQLGLCASLGVGQTGGAQGNGVRLYLPSMTTLTKELKEVVRLGGTDQLRNVLSEVRMVYLSREVL